MSLPVSHTHSAPAEKAIRDPPDGDHRLDPDLNSRIYWNNIPRYEDVDRKVDQVWSIRIPRGDWEAVSLGDQDHYLREAQWGLTMDPSLAKACQKAGFIVEGARLNVLATDSMQTQEDSRIMAWYRGNKRGRRIAGKWVTLNQLNCTENRKQTLLCACGFRTED